jgi:hypothetical protein
MKKLFVSFAKSTMLLLFLLIFSCNSCSEDEIFQPLESVDEETTAIAHDLIEDTNEPPTDVSTVSETAISSENRDCQTSGGKAFETGLKTWCWGDINLPNYTGKTSTFNNGQLGIDSECNENQLTKVGDELRFYVNPQTPAKGWCNNPYNMRAELMTRPWGVNNPKGTEEWFGWSYRFGDSYVPDNENPWLFFQIHHGVAGSPPIELAVVPSRLYGAQTGEVVVINHANKTETDRTRTGIISEAGQKLDIVVHVIHDLGSKGLLQVWINGKSVYDKHVGTVYSFAPWGGNSKFGIYKWPWRQESGVQKSLLQGIDHVETYMGALRIITRHPDDSNFGVDSYAEVAP